MLVVLVTAFAAASGEAQRKPVLPQIDLPHAYYYREMYLPQLTSGPSAVTWSPDSKEVIYSMAGSLWRQRIDSTVAQQLTDGPGYDYQPDWSPDGLAVVYSSYQKDAIELRLLDLVSGKTQQLTSGGAVNVEPRWSPDGKRIAFVSTMYNKRFHIFVADLPVQKLENVVRLSGETKSTLPRYYYSAYDHEISPVWSPDGAEILFVSNRGRMYGTGGFWRMKVQGGAEPREIHYEETTWKARPDFSPDGTRIVYSSYLGRQWHQLWVLPAHGGDAFPISYGEWDETSVRWSRDGKQLAFISNRNGNTELWIQQASNGAQHQLQVTKRRYLYPMSRLKLRFLDQTGRPTPTRASVTDEEGRFYAPEHAWIQADDAFDRTQRRFEAQYFHMRGEEEFDVPDGQITVEIMRGIEDEPFVQTLEMVPGEPQTLIVKGLRSLNFPHPKSERWASGDLHVHMNYGGAYRNTPAHLVEQAQAENLSIVNNLIVNKEQRIPDIAYAGRRLDPASTADTLVMHGQEFHTSYWGHLGLVNIGGNILLPDYAGYPNTAAASLVPTNAAVEDRAHGQGALVGYVHPFGEEPQPLASPPQTITHTLPVDIALGKVDYLEVVGFSDHRATAAVWYRLLNLGFRIPAGAGTDAMANFASLHGPVGMSRVYARVPEGPIKLDVWLEAVKHGRTFATNGPLLDFSLGGQPVGGELKVDTPQDAVPFQTTLRSIVPVDHLEIVCNGRVVQALALDGPIERGDFRGKLPLRESGWCVLRASSDKTEYPVLDNYVYATTSPVYVTVAGKPPHSPEDAAYFAAWIDRVIEATSRYPDWNAPAEKEAVLKELARARAVYEKLQLPQP